MEAHPVFNIDSSPAPRTSMLIILLLALLPRLAFVYFTPQILFDTYMYEEIGYAIAHGCGVAQIKGMYHPVRDYSVRPVGESHQELPCDHFTPTYVRPPIYPFFLSLFYRFSLGDTGARVAQALLDALIAVALFVFGRRYFNRFTGWFAGLFFAFHPFVIIWPRYILTEAPFADLLAVAVLLLAVGWTKDRLRILFFAGLALGVATLCRTTSILLPLFLPLIFLRREQRQQWKRTVMQLLMVGLGFCAVMAPWVIRNDRIFHERFLVSGMQSTNLWVASLDWDSSVENSGIAFWLIGQRFKQGETFGLGPVVPGKIHPLQPMFGGNEYGDPINMLAAEKVLRRHALENIRRAPFHFLWNRIRAYPGFLFESFYYFPQTLGEYRREGNWAAILGKLAYNLIFHALVFFLALVGCLEIKRSLPLFFMALPTFYLLAVHLPLFHEVRYSLPMYPFLAVLSAVGTQVLWIRWRKFRSADGR